MMTEIEELGKWSAEKVMGWVYKDNSPSPPRLYSIFDKDDCFVMMANRWHPDDPDTGQIWMVVERMRKLGWYLHLFQQSDYYDARFHTDEEVYWGYLTNTNPCLAILRAAKAAWRDDDKPLIFVMKGRFSFLFSK